MTVPKKCVFLKKTPAFKYNLSKHTLNGQNEHLDSEQHVGFEP